LSEFVLELCGVPHIHGHKRLDDDATGWWRRQWSTGQTVPTQDVFWIHRCQIFWSSMLFPAEHSRCYSRSQSYQITWRPLSNWWCKCEQSNTNNYSVVHQFGTSAFNMVVWW